MFNKLTAITVIAGIMMASSLPGFAQQKMSSQDVRTKGLAPSKTATDSAARPLTEEEITDAARRMKKIAGNETPTTTQLQKQPATGQTLDFTRVRPINLADSNAQVPQIEGLQIQWHESNGTGEILEHYNNTRFDGAATAQATDLNGEAQTIHSYQAGAVYYMIDASRPIWQAQQTDVRNAPKGALWTLDLRNHDLSSEATLNHVLSNDNTWNDRSAVSAHSNMGYLFEYYLNTQSNFVDMRVAAIQPATDLFGANSPEVSKVKDAFTAVGIMDGNGSEPPEELPPVHGEHWIAAIAADPNNSSLFLARPIIQSQQDIVQLTATRLFTMTSDWCFSAL